MSADIEKDIAMKHPEKTSHIGHEETQHTKQIETVHNDEAVKVLATYHGEETWDDSEEKRLRRKLDWKLMPILCLTYGLQYYDKAMLSQAVSKSSCSKIQKPDGLQTGSFWVTRRLGSIDWHPLLIHGCHLLSGLHPRHISNYAVSTEISS